MARKTFDLAIQSLESLGSGIRLLKVLRKDQSEERRDYATVYVPHNKRSFFLKRIQAYANEIDSRSNKPKNYRLIDSISDIRMATLESFWRSDELNLIPGDIPTWLEVWLYSDSDETINRFNEQLVPLHIEAVEGVLKFPERAVKLIKASRHNLEKLIEVSDDIAEFRAAKEAATFYIEMNNRDQVEFAQELLERTQINKESNVSVCILDTGVNNGHILIQPVLNDNDLHTVNPAWGNNDHDGHGTLMAGTVAFGDLLAHLNSDTTIVINHRLESAKILHIDEPNLKAFWGHLTAQGISRAEIQAPERKRIICMAVTSRSPRERGRPSSWSAEVDNITSGYEDDIKRLMIISSGNADASINYPSDNLTDEVHDPGQAWNALTVGAYTEKYRITHPSLTGYLPLAPEGGLSPYSTTSLNWPYRKWPIKPEVVMEGGNMAIGPNNSLFSPVFLAKIHVS